MTLLDGILLEILGVVAYSCTNDFEISDNIAIGFRKRYTLFNLILAAMFNHHINGRCFIFHLLLRDFLLLFFVRRIELFLVLFLTHNDCTVNLKLLLAIVLKMRTSVYSDMVILFDEELGWYRYTPLTHVHLVI